MEFEQFGCNEHTISFIGAMITSVIGFVGVIIQYRKIGDAKRAKSVNVTMMSYGALFFAVGGVFGAYIGSFALMFGAIRFFLQLPVLGRIWRHKGFTRTETMLCVVWLAILLAFIFVPDVDIAMWGLEKTLREWIYLAVCVGTVFSFIPQPIEMIRNRDKGELSLFFLVSAWLGIVFWTVYSFAFGIWVLKISNPVMFVLMTVTVVLWFVYRRPRGAK